MKIYYEDTNAGGVVYYANYLRYLERARTEFLSHQGIDVAEYHNEGLFFAVVHVDIHYKQPAKLGDMIEVVTEIKDISNATVTFKHQIVKDSTLLIKADVKIAYIDKDGKPRKIPARIRDILLA